jgi:hypothetical protein
VLVPYSNHQLVDRPPGSTAPFSWADVGPTSVAGALRAPGGATVTNVRSAPRDVPAALVATTR